MSHHKDINTKIEMINRNKRERIKEIKKEMDIQMSREMELFEDGIKPAIILKDNETSRDFATKLKGKCSVVKFMTGNSLMLLHMAKEEIPIKFTQDRLGEVLGYYKPACIEFSRRQSVDRFPVDIINYGGIHFNCMGLFNEAYVWCNGKYLESMIKAYGSVKVKRYIRNREWKEEIQYRYIVYRDKGDGYCDQGRIDTKDKLVW